MTYLKLAPYVLILLLLCGLLYFRSEAIKADGIKDTAMAQNDALRAVNEQNAKTMAELTANSKLNDQLVQSLAVDVAAIKNRGTTTRTIIKEAIANDPVTKAWADEPVPAGVRAALRSDSLPDAKASR